MDFPCFLDRYGSRCPLYLEIKANGIEERVVSLVRQRGLLDRVVFTSFDAATVARVAALARVRTCWLVREWSPSAAEQSRAIGLYEVSINAAHVDAAIAERVRAAGFGVRAWGLRDDDLMRRAVAAGLDGVTIDFPDRLIRLLRPSPRAE